MAAISSSERSRHRPTRTSGPTPSARGDGRAGWRARPVRRRSSDSRPKVDGDGVRRPLPPAPRRAVDAAPGGVRGRGAVPLRHHALALGRAHQLQPRQAARGVRRPLLQHPLQVLHHAADGGALEQVGAVVQPPGQPVAAPRAATSVRSTLAVCSSMPTRRTSRPGSPAPAAPAPSCSRTAPGRGARGSGCARGAAPPPAFRTAPPGASYAPSVVSRTRRSSSRNAGSPDRSVRSTSVFTNRPIERLHLRAACAPATGGAHHHVVRAGVAGQQRLEGGQQHHEQRGAFAPRQRAQPLQQLGREVHGLGGARGGRPRPGADGRWAAPAAAGAPASRSRHHASRGSSARAVQLPALPRGEVARTAPSAPAAAARPPRGTPRTAPTARRTSTPMLHPSPTAWCRQSSSTCSSPPSRSSVRAKERARRQVERPRRLFGQAPRASPPRAPRRRAPERSSTGSASPANGATTCTGPPSASAKVVRSASWRRTISPSARSSAATSSAPAGAARRRCCRAALPGSIRSRNHSRCCAKESGSGRPRPRARQRRQRGRARPPRPLRPLHPVRPARPRWAPRTARAAAAPPAARRGRARPSAWPAASARPARRSRRPRPPASTPSTSAQIAASTASAGGARRRVRSAGRARPPGAGSAPRSTLPLGVSGSASRAHERGGDHVLRQAAPQVRAQLVSASGPAHHVRHQPPVAGRVRRAPPRRRRARRHGARSAVSTSPGSTRKPRTFTCSSSRPRNSSVPSASHRARSPVRYSRAPGPPANGSGTKRSAVSAGPVQVAARHPAAARVQLAGHADGHGAHRARPARRRGCRRWGVPMGTGRARPTARPPCGSR